MVTLNTLNVENVAQSKISPNILPDLRNIFFKQFFVFHHIFQIFFSVWLFSAFKTKKTLYWWMTERFETNIEVTVNSS